MKSGRNTGEIGFEVPIITSLIAATFLAAYFLVPWWLFFFPAISTIVLSVLVITSTKISSNNMLLGSGPKVPVWMVLSLPFVCSILLGLVKIQILSVRSVVAAVLVGAASVLFLAAISGGRIYNRILSQQRVSWWFLGIITVSMIVVSSAIIITNGSVTGLAFLAAFILLSLYLWLIVPLSTIQRWKEPATTDADPPYPTLSVIIPAYNEEKCIGQCIESVLHAEYPTKKLDIVVVDDGSDDDTYKKAIQHRDQGVKVFHKDNGGKYSALNYGLLCSSSEIVVSIDADSYLTSDALLGVVTEFQRDSAVGAVGGNVKVRNRNSILTRLQAIEYLIGFNTYRRAFSWFGAVPIIPGCLSAFRREALEQAHGYDPDTVTEDFDTTLKILKEGWKVTQCSATVWTEAPFTIRDLYRQRRRWYTGSIETVLKHIDVFVDTDSKYLHRFSFPFFMFRLFCVPAVILVVYVTIIAGLRTRPYETLLVVVLPGLLLASLLALLVIRMDSDTIRLVPYGPLFIIGYKQFLEAVLLFSLLYFAVFKEDQTWGSIRRRDRINSTVSDAD